jgi:hypothetical protein
MAAEFKQAPLHTLDKKLYEMVKEKRHIRMV